MPPSTNAARGGFEIDREHHTIRFLRDFDQPSGKVFRAWTRPEHVACWWDTTGERLTVCEIDLRPGGAFSFVTKSHPEMPFAGVYVEVAPPSTLIFEAMGATGRVTLTDQAGGTRMLVEIQCLSAEHLDRYLQMGIDQGTARTLDNLVEYLSRRDVAA